MKFYREVYFPYIIASIFGLGFSFLALHLIGKPEVSLFDYWNLFVFILTFLIIIVVLFIAIFHLKNIDKISFAERIQRFDSKQILNSDDFVTLFDENSEEEQLIKTMFIEIKNSYDRLKNYSLDITHEIKTPLTIMRGELEMGLISAKNYDDFIMILGSSLDEIYRLNKLVDNLLEISLAESGRLQYNFQQANLSLILDDIAEDAEVLASDKSIKVLKNVESDVIINIDPDRIHQALLNLVDNSIKFTGKGGEVNISLQNNSEFAVISIEDNGIGIDEELQPYIFDRYYRTKEAKESNIKGSGLGLSIVNSIIKAHKGEISLKSKLQVGTEFKIRLPLKTQ